MFKAVGGNAKIKNKTFKYFFLLKHPSKWIIYFDYYCFLKRWPLTHGLALSLLLFNTVESVTP